jgi:hypothetical protein
MQRFFVRHPRAGVLFDRPQRSPGTRPSTRKHPTTSYYSHCASRCEVCMGIRVQDKRFGGEWSTRTSSSSGSSEVHSLAQSTPRFNQLRPECCIGVCCLLVAACFQAPVIVQGALQASTNARPCCNIQVAMFVTLARSEAYVLLQCRRI